MSLEYLNLAFKADIKKSSTKFVLVAMADYANEVGEAYPTIETIAKKTSLNRKTIISALKELVDLGFISDTGLTRGRTGQVKVWKLHIKSTENGTVNKPDKEYQKGDALNSTKNGTVSDGKGTKNGTVEGYRFWDTEPSDLLTIKEKINKKENSEKPLQKKSTRFTKPLVEEIRAYCQERNNRVNPQRFFDYYESNGWMVGRTKMKDWKAAVRTWEQREKEYATRISGDAQSNYLEELAALPDW